MASPPTTDAAATEAAETQGKKTNKLENRPRNVKKAFDMPKNKDPERSRSNSVRNSRSQSFDLELDSSSNSLNDKSYSVTILVNENEKNKIVDMIHKAKSLISKKVEKVIGKKPKSGISNVEALQTVLESWVGREERKEMEEKAEEAQLIRDQEAQVSEMRERGVSVPVSYKPVPEVSIEEHKDGDVEEELSLYGDMTVARIRNDRYLQSPTRRHFSPASQGSITPTLCNAENVPCPWGFRPESELYPPKLRRPSSLYGADVAAAYSRPASASPSFYAGDDHSIPSSTTETIKQDLELTEEDELDEPEEDQGEKMTDVPPIKYARPDSYLVPIGGVWKPEEDGTESELAWGKVEESMESSSQEPVQDKGSCSIILETKPNHAKMSRIKTFLDYQILEVFVPRLS